MTDITNLPVLPASQNSIALVIVTTPDGRGGSNPPMQANLAIATGGATGAQGIQGIQGAQGTAGLTGLTGPAGIAGAIGLTGASSIVPGPPGATGPIGSTGATGAASAVAGPTGATGSVGPGGVPGPIGATGPASTVQGPQGPIGNMGGAGPAGAASTVPGPAGATGTAGTAGATGLTGAAGTAGTAGATGAVGPAGPAGPTGATGSGSGTPGATGATGPAGPAGPTGATGAAGSSGGSTTPVTTVYTAAGAIALTDVLAVINSTAAIKMTLANATTDGQTLIVKRLGSGVAQVSATIDGLSQTVTMSSVSLLRETLTLTWSTSLATWLARAGGVIFGTSNNVPSCQYWRIRITVAQSASYSQISKLAFLDSAGNNQALVAANFTVSSNYNATFDLTNGSGGSDWISGTATVPQTVAYNFGSAVQVVSIAMYSGSDANFARGPSVFFIETSADGTTWNTLSSPTVANWYTSRQLQTFSTI